MKKLVLVALLISIFAGICSCSQNKSTTSETVEDSCTSASNNSGIKINADSINEDFEQFVKLFEEHNLPFVTEADSSQVENLAWDEKNYKSIPSHLNKFIPDSVYKIIGKEQSKKAYYRLPISDRFISLVLFGGSFDEDEPWVTSSNFFLVNYTLNGAVIDFVKIAGFIFERETSWCTVTRNQIIYNSWDRYPGPIDFDYDYTICSPMIEVKYKYNISPDGHFSKEVISYKEGVYAADYGSITFSYKGPLPR